MSYSVLDSKNDLTGILHGTSLSKVVNILPLMNRAARDVLAEVDFAETKRVTQLNSTLYDQVYDYQCPSDLKGDRIIDIRPQVRRNQSDRFDQTYNEEFDMNKESVWRGGIFTTQWNTGVKSLRISKQLQAGSLLNGCDSLTSNGTWAATSLASNLSLDTVNYVSGGGSLKFDLGAGGAGATGYVENSTSQSVDISSMEDQGAMFVWVYMPTASDFTNVILRWGSSSSNYWSVTATTTQDSTSFQNGWNLIKFDWLGASETGTPDSSDITYLRVTLTYDGSAQTAARVDNIVARMGSIYQIEYYSKDLFRDASTGAFKENATADTDLVNLDTDSYNVWLYRTAYLAAQQIQASDSAFDAKFFGEEYDRLKTRYQAKYKSEVIKPQQPYYEMTRPPRFRNWWSR